MPLCAGHLTIHWPSLKIWRRSARNQLAQGMCLSESLLVATGRGKSLLDPGLRDTLKPDFYLAEEDHLREKGMFWETLEHG